MAVAWLSAGQRTEAFAALKTMQAMDPKAKNVFNRAAINLLDAGCLDEAKTLALISRTDCSSFKPSATPDDVALTGFRVVTFGPLANSL